MINLLGGQNLTAQFFMFPVRRCKYTKYPGITCKGIPKGETAVRFYSENRCPFPLLAVWRSGTIREVPAALCILSRRRESMTDPYI